MLNPLGTALCVLHYFLRVKPLFPTRRHLLRGTIVNRTYVTHQTLYIYLFALKTFGPIYYGPP